MSIIGNRIKIVVTTKKGVIVNTEWHRPSKAVKQFFNIATKKNWINPFDGVKHFANMDVSFSNFVDYMKRKGKDANR